MNKFTFSKWLVVLATAIFIVAFIVGIVVIILESLGYGSTSSLGELLTFTGGPFAVITSFYLWKAKNENMHKFKPGEPDELIDEESEEENDV